MKFRWQLILSALLGSILLSSCGSKEPERRYPIDFHKKKSIKRTIETPQETPKLSLNNKWKQEEMRGVWLTTAYNLDWPDKPASNLFEAQQQQDALKRILDAIKKDGYNTVFFEVRTSTGVLYPSELEPYATTIFSEWSPKSYDPTAFAIEGCHKRGLEIHAWFITLPMGGKKAGKRHRLYKELSKHLDYLVLHKGGWYLNPGEPGARKYLAQVIGEAARKYDFDGIHLDYIRYPEGYSSFPDSRSYERYGRGQDLDSWRRDNITQLVGEIRAAIDRENPKIVLSAATLGKLRKLPEGTISRKYGWTAYESVLQDPIKWAKRGYVDFIVPMMYYKDELYSPFLDDWLETIERYCPVVVGLAPYRTIEESSPLWQVKDIMDQIDEAREKGASGVAMFRYKHVSHRYPQMRQSLQEKFKWNVSPLIFTRKVRYQNKAK